MSAELLVKACEVCGVEFHKKPWTSRQMWYATTRFCSLTCKGIASRGTVHPYKGGKVRKRCKICEADFDVWPHLADRAKYCSRRCAARKEMPKGDRASNWKGGVTPEHRRIRASTAYHSWRRAVFKRDDYRCQVCGSDVDVQADHIKPFALFPHLRLDVANGQTLCRLCHKDKTAGEAALVKSAGRCEYLN